MSDAGFSAEWQEVKVEQPQGIGKKPVMDSQGSMQNHEF